MKVLFLLAVLSTSVIASDWCHVQVIDIKKHRLALEDIGVDMGYECSCNGKVTPKTLKQQLNRLKAQTAGQYGKYKVDNAKNESSEFVYSLPMKILGITTYRSYFSKSMSACRKSLKKYK